MRLRALNEQGLEAFAAYIESSDPIEAQDSPRELLEDSRYSEPLDTEVEVPLRKFRGRLDLAVTLDQILPTELRQEMTGHRGIWSWLALYWLDQLAPVTEGQRRLGKAYRYVLSTDFRHVYRHLVAGPFYFYRLHGEFSRVLLGSDLSRHGDFAEQLASRMDFITNASVIRTADSLYFDTEKNRTKKGATNRKKGGTLRRFILVLQQLERNYDLYGMSDSELLRLLPPEFTAWRA